MFRRLVSRLTTRAALFLCLGALVPCAAPAQAEEDWKINGEIYRDVTVTTISPTSVVIRHSRGLISLPLNQLPADLQKRFNYDAGAEEAFRKAQEAKEKSALERRAAKKETLEARSTPPSDPRSDRLSHALRQLAQPAILAEAVDLRPSFTEFGLAPRNQGRRPSCAIFAITSALEYALARSGKKETLSEEYLIWATARALGQTPTLIPGAPPIKTKDKDNEAPSDLGFSLESVIQGAHQFGIAHKEDLPNALYGSVRGIEDPSETIIAEARQRHSIFAAELAGKTPADKIAPIITMLNHGWPVVIGLRWPNAVTLRERPVLHAQEPLPDYGHAVTLVGYYAEERNPERLVFVFRNSWGLTWGMGGHGFVSRDYLVKNLRTAMVLDLAN